MTTESQVDVFTPAERINLLVQFTGQAMQGLLANPATYNPKDPTGCGLTAAAVGTASDVVTALEDHFRAEYADKAAALKAAQEAAANQPRIVVPGGGITQ